MSRVQGKVYGVVFQSSPAYGSPISCVSIVSLDGKLRRQAFDDMATRSGCKVVLKILVSDGKSLPFVDVKDLASEFARRCGGNVGEVPSLFSHVP